MKNEIKIEMTFIEALELRSAITARIMAISRDTTMGITYRSNTIETLMQGYDKINEQIEKTQNK